MSTYEYFKSMEEIAAGLAHEVKNPLSLVKANLDLLELNDLQKRYEKNYKIMHREIERINDLLLDFIQFAKPTEDYKTVFSLNALLFDLIDSLILAHTNIDFISSFEEHECNLFGDEDKIRRVILNILKNAIEAIEGKDAGVIKISLSQNDKFIILSISDNGKGITSDEQKKICSPFYTTKSGGSGLGLYLSNSIIGEHGGKFEIEGKEGEGCLVTIKLPIEGQNQQLSL